MGGCENTSDLLLEWGGGGGEIRAKDSKYYCTSQIADLECFALACCCT